MPAMRRPVCCLRACVRASGRGCGIGVRQARSRTSPAFLRRASRRARRRPAGCYRSAPRKRTTWNVYSDGRVIWQKWTSSGDATVVPAGARRLDTGYVQQRLTLEGVQLLLSKILATGLFEHNLMLASARTTRGSSTGFGEVIDWSRSWSPFTRPIVESTLHQPNAGRDGGARVDRAIRGRSGHMASGESVGEPPVRAFVPARYVVAFDRSYPDISKLPSPAGKVLVQYKPLRRDGCQVLTTGQARALLQAFVKAGMSPSENHAFVIAFDFAGLHLPHPQTSTCPLPFQKKIAANRDRSLYLQSTEPKAASIRSRARSS